MFVPDSETPVCSETMEPAQSVIGHLATGLAGAVLGVAVGIGAPAFYISRDNADEVSN